LATNSNLTNKSLNIGTVQKTMLSCADLLGLGKRIVDDNKHTTEWIRFSTLEPCNLFYEQDTMLFLEVPFCF
jgi:hypothetical protein